MTIPTSHGHSHLTSTSCDHSHLAWMSDGVPSTMDWKVTLFDHFHLMSTWRDHSHLLCRSPPLHSLTLYDHSHLACMSDGVPSTIPWKVTLHNHFHLTSTLHNHYHHVWAFSPCIHLSLPFLPHMHVRWGPLHYTLKSHLAWPFPPCIHLIWPYLPCVHVRWGPFHHPLKSHLVWPFPLYVGILTLHSFHMTIPTSHACQMGSPPPPPEKSPCMTISSSHPPHMTIPTLSGNSHLASTSYAPLHTKVISFTSCGKISKKSWRNPYSINKVPLTSHQQWLMESLVDFLYNWKLILKCKL